MDPLSIFSEAKKLFTVCEDDSEGPEIDLHKVIDEATSGQGGRWNEEARKEGEWKLVPQKLEKREVQDVCRGFLYIQIKYYLYVFIYSVWTSFKLP